MIQYGDTWFFNLLRGLQFSGQKNLQSPVEVPSDRDIGQGLLQANRRQGFMGLHPLDHDQRADHVEILLEPDRIPAMDVFGIVLFRHALVMPGETAKRVAGMGQCPQGLAQ